MLDPAIPRNALIAAALRLASERPWADVTLADIADAAGTTLPGLKKEFGSKGEVIAAFIGAVDDEMLARAPKRAPDQPVRDTLFEVIMCRFDVLAPYRPALRSIMQSGLPDPAQVRPLLESQRWMLEAAGVNTAGVEGGRSEEHTSELQSQSNLVCRLLLEKKKNAAGQRGADGRTGLVAVLRRGGQPGPPGRDPRLHHRQQADPDVRQPWSQALTEQLLLER